MKPRSIVTAMVTAACLIAAMAYGSSLAAREAEREADEAATTAEVVLQAFSADDYTAFAARLADDLRDDLDESAFEAWRTPLADQIGGFVGIIEQERPRETQAQSVRHVFDTAFERDEHVRLVMVLKPSGDIKRIELQPDG